MTHHASLQGGSSAEVILLEGFQKDGKIIKCVHRLYGEADLQQNPNVAYHEYRVLELCKITGLKAPAPLYLDEPEYLFGRPSIVTEYISASVDLKPRNLVDYILKMSHELAQIHQMKSGGVDLSFLLERDECGIQVLGDNINSRKLLFLNQEIIEQCSALCPLQHKNTSVILHGDYWPGNILWKDGQLKAIIDWEDTRLGDPLADLSNARLEILMLFDSGKMDLFTENYGNHNQLNFYNLPWWDLYTASRFINKLEMFVSEGRDKTIIETKFFWFVEHAKSRMG